MDKHKETRLHLGRLTRLLNDPLLRIDASSLTRISDLGEGGFAHVELCTLNQGGVKRKVAVKRFHESILADDTCLKLLCQEIEVMAKNKHPYMIQLLGVGAGDSESEETIRKSLFIVQDYCRGGNLKHLVREQSIQWGAQGLTASDLLSWCVQLATVLSFLHSQSPAIIHRDIKLENILLASPLKGRSKGQGPEIRLIDFGLACPLCAADKKPDPGPERSSFQPTIATRISLMLGMGSPAAAEAFTPRSSQVTNRILKILMEEEPVRKRSRNDLLVSYVDKGDPKEAVSESLLFIQDSQNGKPNRNRGSLDVSKLALPGLISTLHPTKISGTHHHPAADERPSATRRTRVRISTSSPKVKSPLSNRNPPLADTSFTTGGKASNGSSYRMAPYPIIEVTYDEMGAEATTAPSPTEVLLELSGQTGSLLYMPPEVYNEQPYNEKADVFSFAMVMYELLHRRTLMDHVFEINPRSRSTEEAMEQAIAEYAQMVGNGYRPPMGTLIPPCLSDVITKCWSQKSSDRPSMSDVLATLQKISQEEELSSLNSRPGGAGCSDFCNIQ